MQYYISIPYKARYFTHGNFSEKTKNIWFVCHGYGQLAEYFIKKFHTLNTEENFVIAPEGLHRFYLNGHYGRVGASWMTKEDRLTDIDNYIHYLDCIYQANIKNTTAKIILLGFSQGAATASRWAAFGYSKFDKLILWAGVFPPDLPFEDCFVKINNLKPLLVVGTKDEFISAEELNEKTKWLDKEKINYKLIQFEGRHDIDNNVLIEIYQNYI
jgi:predicted esterase